MFVHSGVLACGSYTEIKRNPPGTIMNSSSYALGGLPVDLAQFKAQTLASMLFADGTGNPISDLPRTVASFDTWLASAKQSELATPTTPTGLDASRPFSLLGQNVMTVINRVEVTFKAQFSELS